MKAIRMNDRFGIEHLKLEELARPVPKPGEVLVRLLAASLNYRDLHVIGGVRALKLPLIPLSDGAGRVVEAGEGVQGLAVGDRVMPTFVQGWLAGRHPDIDPLPTLGGPLDGVMVEYGVWPEAGLVRVPDYLTDVEAACLPCAAVSAWNALFGAEGLEPGQTVLVQGTGGVSLFALQFAKAAGARVIVTSSSDAKLERAAALGADDFINYTKTSGWGRAAREIVARGADVVVDIGGAATFEESLAALRNGGRISMVGFVSGTRTPFDASDNRTSPVTVGSPACGFRGNDVTHLSSACPAPRAGIARKSPAGYAGT
jgi:NADPH:quinone reductase-like Zn-dependent oxidoreductase